MSMSISLVLPARARPWLDRGGRVSALKLLTFVALFAPLLWIILQWRLNWLGSKPVTEAIHQTGLWSVRFLLVTFAVTPLRFIGAWPKLFLVRRMLGLAALAYALLHLVLYVVQEAYNIPHVIAEIVLRFYLTIGFVALLALVALGVTSTDAMISRMGHVWHLLHRAMYAVIPVALLHFFIQSKIDVTEAVLMAGLFFLLLLYRLARRSGYELTPLALLAIAVVGGLATMATEGIWYGAATGVPALAVLKANFDVSYTIRPGWWVMLAGATLAGLRACRPAPSRRRARA
jgi:sulfoxide reductase heme-binding subunit YedZ